MQMKRYCFKRVIKLNVKGILLFYLLLFLPVSVLAQEFRVLRGSCTPGLSQDGVAEARAPKAFRLPSIINNWDPNREYRQLVILVSYKGDNVNFSMENPKATYDSIFNMKGYAGHYQRKGKGCVADYFRDQSNGLFNLKCDVYGPYQVSKKAQPFDNPTSKSANHGTDAMREATNLFLAENPNIDFSQYDWNNNGHVNQVIFVHAGFCGNIDSEKVYGYLWPNTSSFNSVQTPDGKIISSYSASAELWPNNTLCGIGTICHEYTHSLGLPDVYPTSGNIFSVIDEWDLMDGGNFTNYGWCPPNWSAHEKMLLGWLKPIELTEATTITDLKSTEDGGAAYMIKHTDNEFLMLENRQWSGWDFGLPGKGLVIYHVNYNSSKWLSNTINNSVPFNYTIMHADNRDYDQWAALCSQRGLKYQNPKWLNSYTLSGSSYPYDTDSTEVVDELTDTSVPAATMINANSKGSKLLSKPITNVKMSSDGLVSFDFMGGKPTGVSDLSVLSAQPTAVYDLQGHNMTGKQLGGRKGIYLIRQSDGTVKKLFK